MSCEGKHNNSDFKFCPECGIKLDNEEEVYVKQLNDRCKDYVKTMNEFGIDTIESNTIEKYLEKMKIEVKYEIFYCEYENKFYSMKEIHKILNIELPVDKKYINSLGTECYQRYIYNYNRSKIFHSQYSIEDLCVRMDSQSRFIKLASVSQKIVLNPDDNYLIRTSQSRIISELCELFKTTDEIKGYLQKMADAL